MPICRRGTRWWRPAAFSRACRVRQARHLHAAGRHRRSARRRQHRGGHRTHAVERLAVLGDDRRGQPLPTRRPVRRGARRWSCCRRTRSAISSTGRPDRPRPISSSKRSRARGGRGGLHLFKAGVDILHAGSDGNERERAGADPPLGRHAGAPARLRPADRAGDRQHRPGAVRAGPAAADQSLVMWSSARASTATA